MNDDMFVKTSCVVGLVWTHTTFMHFPLLRVRTTSHNVTDRPVACCCGRLRNKTEHGVVNSRTMANIPQMKVRKII